MSVFIFVCLSVFVCLCVFVCVFVGECLWYVFSASPPPFPVLCHLCRRHADGRRRVNSQRRPQSSDVSGFGKDWSRHLPVLNRSITWLDNVNRFPLKTEHRLLEFDADIDPKIRSLNLLSPNKH